MTYCGHCDTFSGCKLFIRQKNIEQKSSLNARMFVQSSLTNICSFNVVHLRCWEYYSTFVEKNKRSGCLLLFCFLKNAVLALQILLLWWACGSTGGSLLMHGLTNGHHPHSYVLLFLCPDYLFASCLWRHEIPGPGQGWRGAGSVQDGILQGKTWSWLH